MEAGAFASSPILPAAGAPAVTARAADVPSHTLASAQGTVVGSFFHYMKVGPVEAKEGASDEDEDGHGVKAEIIEAPPAPGQTPPSSVPPVRTAHDPAAPPPRV